MATAFTPPTMNWNAPDIPDEFKAFKQYCNLVFDGPFSRKTGNERASFILLWIGRQGVDIYNSFVWESEDDKTKPEIIWEKFEKHLAPRTNYRLARFQLQQIRQGPDENIDDFMTRARNQAAKCKFRDQREIDERLIEQLIIGTRHKKAQERILEKDEKLSLDEALDYARTYEATLSHVAQLHETNENLKSVHALSKVADTSCKKTCQNCGTEHEARKCPAYGTTCNFCSKANHWAKVCRQKTSNKSFYQNRGRYPSSKWSKTQQTSKGQGQNYNRRVHGLKVDEEMSEEFETLVFDTIKVNSIAPNTSSPTKDEALVTISIDLPNHNNCST